MTTLRIVKRYNHRSNGLAGVEVADTVNLPGAGSHECAQFVTRVNSNDELDYEIIDYEVALISKMDAPEILTNPTGGKVGKIDPNLWKL